jgi:MFS family permease
VPATDQPPDEDLVPPTAGAWSPGRRALTVGLVLVVTLVASEALAIATVLPEVERELGDLPLYGWVFSAFFLGNLVGVVVAGRMADRVRPTIPFALGIALFVVGLIGGGVAHSMLQLVLARGVQGLGAGALPAIAYVCIGRAYPDHARPRMFAVLSTAWVLPSAVGPGLAAFVGEHWSWRWVFLGLLPVVVVAGAIAMWALRVVPGPSESAQPSRTSIGGVIVLALSTAVLLTALGDIREPRSWIVLPFAIVFAVLAYRSLTPPGTLRAARGVPATISCQGLFAFAFFSADAFVPLALTSVRGTSVLFAGGVITTVTLAWTAGSWLQDRSIRRIGPRPIVRTGLGLLMAGSAGMALMLRPEVPVVLAIPVWALAGLGAGFTFGPLSAAMLSAAPAGTEGQTTAAFQLTEVLGIALGTGAAGAIVALGSESELGTASSVAIVFGLAAVAAAVAVLITPRLPASVLTVAATGPAGTAAVASDETTEPADRTDRGDGEKLPDAAAS